MALPLIQNAMDTREQLTELLARIDELTEADKGDIRALCAEHGVPLSKNRRCPNCYRDALLLLCIQLGVKTGTGEVETASGNYVYSGGVQRVVWKRGGTQTVLSAASDDATIARFMAEVPTQVYFKAKVKETNDDDKEQNGNTGTRHASNASDCAEAAQRDADTGDSAV